MSRYNVQPYPKFRNPLPTEPMASFGSHGQQPATWTPENMPTLEPLRPAEPGEAFPDTEKAWWKPNGGSISMLANYKKSTTARWTKEMKLVCSVYTNSSHEKRALALQIGNDKVFASVYAHFNRTTEQWEPKCIFNLEDSTESNMYNIEQHGNDLFVKRNGKLEKATIIE